jgi:hypothetical protein
MFLSDLMKWMSHKIHLAEEYQTDKEKMDASTWGGVNAVASFEENNINLKSIIEFKVSVSNKTRENRRN